MDSRQVRRARERRQAKFNFRTYPMKAQRGGPSTQMIRTNRKFRGDHLDYFPRQ